MQILSKSDQVRNYLLEMIETGQYQVGDKVPSDNVLTKELSISRNTVREAISSLVSDKKLVRIQGKGTFVNDYAADEDIEQIKVAQLVGYERKDCTSHLEPNFLILLNELNNSLGIKDWAARANWINDYGDIANSLKKWVAKKQVCAFVCFGFTMTEELLDIVEKSGVPVISIGRPEPDKLIPYVDTDHVTGMYEATEYLIRNGHRDIAFLNQVSFHQNSHDDRLLGYHNAMNDYGLKVNEDLIFSVERGGEAYGQNVVGRLLEENRSFTAVIACMRTTVVGVFNALNHNGLHVPDDVSVIAYTSEAEYLSNKVGMGVTAVRQSFVDLGKAAGELIVKLSEGNKNADSVIIKPELRMLESVANITRRG